MTQSPDITHELRLALAGAYDIEAPIGRGGMAHVYLAASLAWTGASRSRCLTLTLQPTRRAAGDF